MVLLNAVSAGVTINHFSKSQRCSRIFIIPLEYTKLSFIDKAYQSETTYTKTHIYQTTSRKHYIYLYTYRSKL